MIESQESFSPRLHLLACQFDVLYYDGLLSFSHLARLRACNVPTLSAFLFGFARGRAHLCECTLPAGKLRVLNPCVIIYDALCKV